MESEVLESVLGVVYLRWSFLLSCSWGVWRWEVSSFIGVVQWSLSRSAVGRNRRINPRSTLKVGPLLCSMNQVYRLFVMSFAFYKYIRMKAQVSCLYYKCFGWLGIMVGSFKGCCITMLYFVGISSTWNLTKSTLVIFLVLCQIDILVVRSCWDTYFIPHQAIALILFSLSLLLFLLSAICMGGLWSGELVWMVFNCFVVC